MPFAPVTQPAHAIAAPLPCGAMILPVSVSFDAATATCTPAFGRNSDDRATVAGTAARLSNAIATARLMMR
jgi:hypothetical protein